MRNQINQKGKDEKDKSNLKRKDLAIATLDQIQFAGFDCYNK